ncbi:MAG: tRNA (adenine-N1)-methyltransferase [Thermoplasmata archaeon]
MVKTQVKRGDVVLIYNEKEKHIIKVDGNFQSVQGLGVIDTSTLISVEYGSEILHADDKYVVIAPTYNDYLSKVERKAQIITIKDSSRIVFELGIQRGSRVLECGAGNGALTILLASIVGDNGMVYAYENNNQQIPILEKNLKMAFLERCVTIKNKNVYEGIEEKDINAAITDIPEPWRIYKNIYETLLPGAMLCSYLPTYNQIDIAYHGMKDTGFEDIHAMELLERKIHLDDNAIRPEFNTLGFTAFMIYGRKTR